MILKRRYSIFGLRQEPSIAIASSKARQKIILISNNPNGASQSCFLFVVKRKIKIEKR